jgi:diguanylate cyclase (GGDEF)-like protein
MLRRIVRYAIERERLLRRAATDPLTGIANRRTFYERLAGEVERAHRYGRPLSVAVFDLDKFKELNDSYGHAAGDEVLDAFARRLAGHHRQGELVARLGGDEFAALLPETDADGGFAFAERVRQSVRNEPLSPHAVVGLSAGIADVEDGRDAHELLRLADEALYWAKGHGRDGSFRWSRDLIERFTQGERAERMDRLQVLAGLRALARVLDARDRGTAGHSERVADLVAALARRRGWGADRTARLREAALIHDVGKVGVPADVLASPGPLVPPRLEQIRRHAALGAQIAREALDEEQAAWIRAQHEQPDGHGYPDGLAGEAIPEGAGLLAVADAFDVMTRTTVYAPARDVADALEECRRVAGTQLDRTVVDLLEAALDDRVDADDDVATGREADPPISSRSPGPGPPMLRAWRRTPSTSTAASSGSPTRRSGCVAPRPPWSSTAASSSSTRSTRRTSMRRSPPSVRWRARARSSTATPVTPRRSRRVTACRVSFPPCWRARARRSSWTASRNGSSWPSSGGTRRPSGCRSAAC